MSASELGFIILSFQTKQKQTKPEELYFLIRDKIQRQQLCHFIVANLCDTNRSIDLAASTLGIFDIFHYELISHGHHLQIALNILQRRDNLSINNLLVFETLLCGIVSSKLYIEFVFARSKLWKPFIVGILRRIIEGYDDRFQYRLFKVLKKTVPVWTDKHYQFAFNNQLMRAIGCVFRSICNDYGDLKIFLKSTQCTTAGLEDISESNTDEIMDVIADFHLLVKRYCEKRRNMHINK